MSTQKVTEKIIQDAKQEADAILNQYKEKAEKMNHEFNTKVATRRKDIKAQAEELKTAEITRKSAQERLQNNKRLLIKKRRLIDTIIKEAVTTLTKHNDYETFLKDLIKQSNLNTGELYINTDDWNKYGSVIKKMLKKEKREYKIVQDDATPGGITIKSQQTTHHGSLDLIRELLYEELTIAVSKQLQ